MLRLIALAGALLLGTAAHAEDAVDWSKAETISLLLVDDRFVPDREDQPGQPTCEGGQHLAMIGMTAATLARAIADFVGSGLQRDYAVSLSGVART